MDGSSSSRVSKTSEASDTEPASCEDASDSSDLADEELGAAAAAVSDCRTEEAVVGGHIMLPRLY